MSFTRSELLYKWTSATTIYCDNYVFVWKKNRYYFPPSPINAYIIYIYSIIFTKVQISELTFISIKLYNRVNC